MKKSRENLSGILLVTYLIVLVKVIVFKYPLFMTREILRSNSLEAFKFRLTTSNFRIFLGIGEILHSPNGLGFIMRNIFGNIFAFMPLGFFMALRRESFSFNLAFSLGLSLGFELIQLITGLGEFDLDDIVLNLVGALLGYLFHGLLFKIFRRIYGDKKI